MTRKRRSTRKTPQQPTTPEESRTLLDSQVDEANLQQSVLQLAHTLGWLCFHVYDSRLACAGYVDPGFPDVALARAGRIIFAELKTEKGEVSLAQVEWLTELALLGRVETYIWRPRDLSSGRIETLLKGFTEQQQTA